MQDPLPLKILDGEVLHSYHVTVDSDKKVAKMMFSVSKRVGEKELAKMKIAPQLRAFRAESLRSDSH